MSISGWEISSKGTMVKYITEGVQQMNTLVVSRVSSKNPCICFLYAGAWLVVIGGRMVAKEFALNCLCATISAKRGKFGIRTKG